MPVSQGIRFVLLLVILYITCDLISQFLLHSL